MRDFSESALLLIGHGSKKNKDSSLPTRRHVLNIWKKKIFNEVQCCFVKESPCLEGALERIESREIYIVPNFISKGYYTQEYIPKKLCLAGKQTIDAKGRTLHYCDPVGTHPHMAEILLQRALKSIPQGILPEDCALLIAGHGTPLNTQSMESVYQQAELLKKQDPRFTEVIPVAMEEPPRIEDWQKLTSKPNVIVVPFFIADGLHSYEDIPLLLGIDKTFLTHLQKKAKESIFAHNPYTINGRKLFYTPSLGSHPDMEACIFEQIEAFYLP